MSFDVPEIIKERDRLRAGSESDPELCSHFNNGICKVDKKKIENPCDCQFGKWIECYNFILHEIDKAEYE